MDLDLVGEAGGYRDQEQGPGAGETQGGGHRQQVVREDEDGETAGKPGA
jgi:hypothetical protein